MANEVQVLDAVPAEDATLNFTQTVRRQIVNDMTNSGKSIPADKGEKIVLLQTLADMDKQVLTVKRMKTDAKSAAANEAAAQVISRLLTQVSPKNQITRDESIVPPSLELGDSEGTFIDGETVAGTQYQDFESFSQKFPSVENGGQNGVRSV